MNSETLADFLVDGNPLTSLDRDSEAIGDRLIQRATSLTAEHAEGDMAVINQSHRLFPGVPDIKRGTAWHRFV